MSLALLGGIAPAQASSRVLSDKDDNGSWSPGPLPETPSVGGKNAKQAKTAPLTGDGRPAWKSARVAWPEAVEAETIPGSNTPTARSGAVSSLLAAPTGGNAPGTPVWVTTSAGQATAPGPLRTAAPRPQAGSSAPGRVKVKVADRKATEAAGVTGVLVSVGRADAGTDKGRVLVGVDYSAFNDAFGADWASRLHLVAMPECVLTTPERPECRVRTPIADSRNDRVKRRVLADVELPATASVSARAAGVQGVTVLALTADASGPSGDYKATSLSPSGSWSVAGNSGSMSWNYPIEVPKVVGGVAPAIALGYNSGSVDGRTTSTNNQASWIGEGWEYSPGFVERSFQPCVKDGQESSSEQCWSPLNGLTLSLNGKSSTIVQDDTDKTKYRLESDDDSRIEPLKGAVNGDDDGEHWRLTTTDGTQYYFGAGHKPGSNNTGTASNAAWTVPVYGNNTGEPCNKASGFDASWCQQAWRWNLDYVVDPQGMLTSYEYAVETNHYKRGVVLVGSGTITPYTRAGQVANITYGSKLTDTAQPTARIVFETVERCVKTADFDCAPAKMTKANATKWPDVPVDQQCAATGTCENYSATFWSTKRLTRIATQVLVAGTYQDVDEFALDQEFPDPQDGSTPTLWLKSITRTAHDGAKKIDLPTVDFAGQLMHNRVDAGGDLAPPMNRRRLTGITTETGGQIAVRYNDAECTPTNLPTPDTNTKACYPTYWSYNPQGEPQLHWFHKYTVAEVTEFDPTQTTPGRSTRYEYVGGAAWHRDDSETTEDKEAGKPDSKDRRTWNQFRGYGQIVTRAGVAPDAITRTAAFYLRGMDGDVKKDGTKRAVTLTDSTGAQIKDEDWQSGVEYESQTFTGDGGTLAATTLTTPWSSAVTATHKRVRNLPPVEARRTDTAKVRERSLLADGTWRETSQTSTFEADHGLETETLHKADGLPDACTRTTYAHNTTAWIIGKPVEIVELLGDCATTATKDTVTDLSRTLYDNLPHGQIGTIGAATSTQDVADYKADGTPNWITTSTTEYDTYGRVTKAVDAENRATHTAFEPATGALPTKMTVTGPTGWSTSTTFAGYRNLPVKTSDVNGLTTEQEFDALGRTLAVWLPGRATSQNANMQFAYALNKTGPSVVTSRTLRADESYADTHKILGAFLQERQTQSSPVTGASGRMITDTFYDTLGRPRKTNQAYYNKDADPNTTIFIGDDDAVPAQTTYVYDGQGRKTAEAFSSKGIEQWRSTIAYPGADQIATTPPPGGTATMAISDARGKTRELREYPGAKPEGTDYTKITYQYAPNEQLKSVVDAAGNTWTYKYDFMGRLVHTEDPDKGASDTTYDLMGRVTQTIDSRGQKLLFTYDNLGRKTGLYKDAIADANLLSSWTYDRYAKGQADGSTRYVGGKNGAAYVDEITGFDTDSYQPTGTRVTIPGIEGNLAGVYETQYTYDKITGAISTQNLPAAGGLPAEKLDYIYTVGGQLGSVGGQDTYVNRAFYDAYGRNTRATLGAKPRQVVLDSAYDQATGRILNTKLNTQTSTTGTIDATAYTYKPNGDLTSIATKRDVGGTDTQCFTYDGMRRLKEAWTDTAGTVQAPAPSTPSIGGCANTQPGPGKIGGPAPYWQTFSYDITGNRTELVNHDPTGNAANDTTITHTYPAPTTAQPHTVRQVTTKTAAGNQGAAYTYDPTGNTTTRTGPSGTQTLTWNPEGKLDTIKTTEQVGNTTFVYDADGNQLIRRSATDTTLLVGNDELVLKTDTNTVTGTRNYPTAGTASIIRSNGRLTYGATDHHGTGTTVLDAADLSVTRRTMKPFGEDRGTPATNWPGQKGFVGGTVDIDNGLTTLGARSYDSALGRFISVDPLIDLTDTQQINGYNYANNNPTSSSDPDGLSPLDDCEPFCNGGDHDGQSSIREAGGGYTWQQIHTDGAVNRFNSNGYNMWSTVGALGMNPHYNTWRTTKYVPHWQEKPKKQSTKSKIWGGLKKGGKAAGKFAYEESGAADAVRCAQGSGKSCALTGVNILLTVGTGGAGKALVTAGKTAGKHAEKRLATKLDDIAGCVAGANSFPAATPVLLADGTNKPIGEIKAGDKVKATDPLTGENSNEPVLDVIVTEVDKNYTELTLMDDTGRASTITSTQHHPYWNASRNLWTDAGDIRVGEQLREWDGKVVAVVAARDYTQQARTYNLTVNRVHTYHVLAGAISVLVHNGKSDNVCPKNAGKLSSRLPKGMTDEIADAYDLVKRGELPSHDVYEGVEHPNWAGALEFAVPGNDARKRILMITFPNGVQKMGWTATHYTKIERFGAPHFPDSGWVPRPR